MSTEAPVKGKARTPLRTTKVKARKALRTMKAKARNAARSIWRNLPFVAFSGGFVVAAFTLWKGGGFDPQDNRVGLNLLSPYLVVLCGYIGVLCWTAVCVWRAATAIGADPKATRKQLWRQAGVSLLILVFALWLLRTVWLSGGAGPVTMVALDCIRLTNPLATCIADGLARAKPGRDELVDWIGVALTAAAFAAIWFLAAAARFASHFADDASRRAAMAGAPNAADSVSVARHALDELLGVASVFAIVATVTAFLAFALAEEVCHNAGSSCIRVAPAAAVGDASAATTAPPAAPASSAAAASAPTVALRCELERPGADAASQAAVCSGSISLPEARKFQLARAPSVALAVGGTLTSILFILFFTAGGIVDAAVARAMQHERGNDFKTFDLAKWQAYHGLPQGTARDVARQTVALVAPAATGALTMLFK